MAGGTWPEIHENPRRKLLIDLYRLIGVLAAVLFMLLPGLYALYYNRHDMLAIVDNLQFTVPLIGTFVKYLDISAGKKALVAVIQGISDDWTKPKNSREREVMVSQAKLGRTIFKVTAVIVVVPITLFVGLPLLGIQLRYNLGPKERPLILQSRFVFNVNVSPNYELTYFAQSYASFFMAGSYTAIDNFIVLLVLHIRGQLRNLRSRMLMLRRSKTFQADLIANVNNHIRLTRTIGVVDSIFTRTFAAILLYFTITSCQNALITIYLLQMDDSIALSRLIFVPMLLLTIFTHTALYCIMGELLVIELEGIYDAVCACEWDTLKPNDARQLLLVMVYTSRPIYLTAAKTIPMNVATLCKMLQMSASYVSFLLAKLQ